MPPNPEKLIASPAQQLNRDRYILQSLNRVLDFAFDTQYADPESLSCKIIHNTRGNGRIDRR